MTHHSSVKPYFAVFAALMLLTFVTVWVATIDLGGLNAVVAVTIAVIKATLVVLIFMHVKDASRLTKVFVAAGVFWLLIIFVLTLGDYETREWQGTPAAPASTRLDPDKISP